MLVGSYLHSVDAKGRVFIPAKYRQDLGSTFYINNGVDDCIRAYNEVEWNKVVELLNQSTVEGNKMRRRIFASTVEVTADAQGRILLPEELRRSAHITDTVKVVGMSEWVEFWAPELFDQDQEEEDKEDIRKLMLAIGMK